MKQNKTVCVVGLGYIGLPTAALLANRGYQVHGVDIHKRVVDIINQGNIHIVEPELDAFVSSAVQSGRLKAGLVPQAADIFIIAVPTPFKDGFKPDIDFVVKATKSIAPFVKKGNIVILESTSPVGTTLIVKDILKEQGVNVGEVFIAYCPERVLPGKIMRELVENARIVGGVTSSSTDLVADFYATFVSGAILKTDSKTAEMAKLSENSYRDVNIAFANELSIICDNVGVNVDELIRLANHHPRVKILQPGAGVGGHCIAVDPWFLVDADPENARLIRTARQQNDYKKEWVIQKIKSSVREFMELHNREPLVACMGLAFKPDIDDLRESPAKHITLKLIEAGLSVLPVEPNLETHPDFHPIPYSEAIEKADIIVFLVKHKEFKGLVLSPDKTILDFCGIGC